MLAGREKEYANLIMLREVFHCENDHLSEERTDPTKHVDEDFLLDSCLFPMVVQVLESGSRADQTNIDHNSDFDYLFEVGPGLVRPKLTEKVNNDDFDGFYFSPAQHDGYYRIENNRGRFLYPKLLQLKVAPMLTVGEVQTEEDSIHIQSSDLPRAAIRKGNEDRVIALRLECWPEKVKKDLEGRLEWCKQLKETSLYFVPKSHPRSEHPKVEWRLSFSLVEKEIMLQLPKMHRKALLIAKKIRKDVVSRREKNCDSNFFTMFSCHDYPEPSNRYNYDNFKSYFLKTALLWRMEKYSTEMLNADGSHLYDLVRNIFQELLEAFKNKYLPNFLTPRLNLLSDILEGERKAIAEVLQELIDVPELIPELIDVTDHCNTSIPGRIHILRSRTNNCLSGLSQKRCAITKMFAEDLPEQTNLLSMFIAEDYISLLKIFADMFQGPENTTGERQNNQLYKSLLIFIRLFQLCKLLNITTAEDLSSDFVALFDSFQSYLSQNHIFEIGRRYIGYQDGSSYILQSAKKRSNDYKKSVMPYTEQAGLLDVQALMQDMEERLNVHRSITSYFDSIANYLDKRMERGSIVLIDDQSYLYRLTASDSFNKTFSLQDKLSLTPLTFFKKLFEGVFNRYNDLLTNHDPHKHVREENAECRRQFQDSKKRKLR